ncbi:MAG TPA: lytic transglycosylase domain-containing protein [Candidatus Polarisedimenticolaceae bacterium]|nr:lytic transglycosylase domain-containing protein [Candidatus Polarisedimenticolaceae bacterium]
MSIGPRQLLKTAILAAWGLAAGPASADELLYYKDKNGDIVFTNTASRSDVKPVPRTRGGPAQRSVTLPATPYDPYIDMVARENGVDPTLVKAVALVESGFNPKAQSSKGAQGLMQLMPTTAKRYGVTNLHDPYQNLSAGAKHLRDLLDQYEGNVTLALAAYNAGAGAVKRYGGVPAYAETQDYVKKVQTKMGRTPRKSEGRIVTSTASKVQMRVEADGSVTLFN